MQAHPSRFTVVVALLLSSTFVSAGQAVAPEVVVSIQDAHDRSASIVYNGARDEYLVVWEQAWEVVVGGGPFRLIMGQRLDRYGHHVGNPFQISPTGDDIDRRQPDVAYDPIHDRYVVVYLCDVDGNMMDLDVRGRWIDGNGPNPGLPEFVIARNEPIAGDQKRWRPRVEFSPVSGKYLVVWWEEGSPAYVMGAFGAFGSPPNGADFNVAVHPTENRIVPDLAHQWVGDRFIVVYASPGNTYVRFVEGATQAVGSEIWVSSSFSSSPAPAVATCQELQFLVTFHEEATGPLRTWMQIHWTSDGSAATFPYEVGTEWGGQRRRPAVACSGTEYLLAYQQEYDPGDYGIWAERIRASSYGVSEPFGVRGLYVGEVDPCQVPVAAGGDTGWMATWEFNRQDGLSVEDLYGAAVWQLFADGFEWAGPGEWSAVVP